MYITYIMSYMKYIILILNGRVPRDFTPPPKIYLFCYFCFCRKHWKSNGKKAAAMARRKREQEFLQALESDNLAGKGMSEA